ncbi:ATP-binding protein [Sinorhizobium meliloti]|uniref:ATP-binding protein n=1 Tax=Rhizobium meliloti TaxID=382 RepID=UPI00398D15B3
MKDYPSLKQRAAIVALNFAIFYTAFHVATGYWLPTSGLESLWLISGITLWLFSLLSSPWFRPPRDTFANAVTALVLLITADLSVLTPMPPALTALRYAGIAWAGLVGFISFQAMIRTDSAPQDAWGSLLRRLCDTLGRGELVYTPPALIGILGAFAASPGSVAALLILWLVMILVRPVELAFSLARQFRVERTASARTPQVGTIDRIDHPNIIRVKLNRVGSWKPGRLHIAAMPDGDQKYLLALFTQVQGTEVVGTGICIAQVAEPIPSVAGCVHESHDRKKTEEFIATMSGMPGSEVAGFTVERSTIGSIYFEVSESLDLAEGEVVFTRLRGETIFYQIVEAQTAEETFDQNPRGTHIVRAVQLGGYSTEKGFIKFPWLPTMNMPVFRAPEMNFPATKLMDRQFIVGTVPSTDIGVAVNIDDLILYHAAILGITGTGKTELALTVIREAVARGSKVFCVDFTGEYRHRLADLNPIFPALDKKAVEEFDAKLFAVDTGAYGAGAEKKDLDKFLKTIRADVQAKVDAFLRSDQQQLAILELSELSSSRASVRVTELFLSTIMEWARANRRARQVLLVLEEAHTIIPETYGAGFDANTQYVVYRIGQIALQGRKYGVGLLVVSQRTALVSKTILSQCNTFFAYSLIDQTSLTFLESVFSHDHVKVIPNLRFLEFLAFGKAVQVERPILLRRKFDPDKKAASEALNRPLPAPADAVAEPGATAPQKAEGLKAEDPAKPTREELDQSGIGGYAKS